MKYSCGNCYKHIEIDDDFYEHVENKNFKKPLCKQCYLAKKFKDAQKANINLPNLEGTEKQINWAEQVRSKKAKEIVYLIKNILAIVNGNKTNIKIGVKILTDALNQNDSQEWIEKRCFKYDKKWLCEEVNCEIELQKLFY